MDQTGTGARPEDGKPKRTLLRLKRRRDTPALPTTLRLSHDDAQDAGTRADKRRRSERTNDSSKMLADIMHASLSISQVKPNPPDNRFKTAEVEQPALQSKRKPIVFKRMTNDDAQIKSPKKRKNEIVRVVDCLQDDEVDGKEDKDSCPASKRSRMTILDTHELEYRVFVHNKENVNINAALPNKRRAARIQSPLVRLFDAQLAAYHESGPSSVSSYVEFVRSVASSAKTKDSSSLSPLTEHLNLVSSDGRGTILHAVALWNDVEEASRIVNVPGVRLRTKDGDGRTALEVAELCGHNSVASVIRRCSETNGGEENDDDFVYDFYYVEEGTESTTADDKVTPDEIKVDDVSENDLFEFRNGHGYWDTSTGEVVIKALAETDDDDSDRKENDDYYDSNDEGHEANDYPEEEEEEEFPSDDELFWENHRMRMHGKGMHFENENDDHHEANLWINKKQDSHGLDRLTYNNDDDDDDDDDYNGFIPKPDEEDEDISLDDYNDHVCADTLEYGYKSFD